ncbi:hypothetical protein NKR74_05305 [Bacillus sp. 3103sda1]|uniref:hypothetical protein n=1 Tax=Bacillus sp. 3103sda1 TaxID=2953808 RepID=UPI00209FC34D|nr:hypothetical protein [Bacillus sp. 3103sda1]MCP1122756.1 hypothetical protein [Bacillus sp. 3103sda1]
MKKLILTMITAMLILSGCGAKFTTENLDKIVSEASKNKDIKKYLNSITYKEIEKSDSQTEEQSYAYDIVVYLDNKFDTLSPKEQYEYLVSVAKIVKKNSGTPQGINGEGQFFCGKDIKCVFDNIVLKTEKHEYYTNYNPSGLVGDWLHLDDKDKSENNIIYDAGTKDGKYVKPGEIEQSNTSTSTVSSQSTNDEIEQIKNATGREWVSFSFDEKFIAVQTVIESMKSAGRSITADAYWFIDALNAYYENGKGPTASEKVIDIMVMSGVAGGVIK